MAGRGLLAAGALAAGAALGAIAERSLLRASGSRDPKAMPDDFGTCAATRARVVATTASSCTSRWTSSPRSPADGLTVIFAHGYALNLDSWHFQRLALRGRARLVFYDQRSHGRSQQADFDTHHVDQLGSDLGGGDRRGCSDRTADAGRPFDGRA